MVILGGIILWAHKSANFSINSRNSKAPSLLDNVIACVLVPTAR